MAETLIVDFAWGRPPPAGIRASGYVGVARYLSPDITKNITQAEMSALLRAGLSVTLVWEAGNQRAALSGAAGGRADGIAANAQANALGWPASRPIYFVMEDPSRVPLSDWPAIDAYAAAAAQTGRVVGGYGGQELIEHMRNAGLIAYGWQVGSWSTGVSPLCHLMQRLTPTRPNPGGSIDENVCLQHDWGQWGGAAVPNAVPAINFGEEANMLSIGFGPGGRVDTCWIAPDKGVWHSWSPSLAAVPNAGSPVEQLGRPGADKLVSVSCQWSPDGKVFLVSGQGIDNLAYVNWYDATTNKWTGFVPLPIVTAATKGLLAPQTGATGLNGAPGAPGTPGTPGTPGATYDDTAMNDRIMAVETATSAAGANLAKVKPAVAKVKPAKPASS